MSPPDAGRLRDAAAHFFRHASPRLIVLFTLAPLGVRAFLGAVGPHDLAVAAAVALLWPVQEWAAHRWILHLRPLRVGPFTVDPLFARRHRAHHLEPHRTGLTLLPWQVVAVAFAASVAAWTLAMPTPALAATGIAAYSAAALAYEWTHFLTHATYRPRTRWFATVVRRHRLHHFKSEHAWYAFTVPLVDDLFRTAPDAAAIETSPTCRTLGLEPVTDAR